MMKDEAKSKAGEAWAQVRHLRAEAWNTLAPVKLRTGRPLEKVLDELLVKQRLAVLYDVASLPTVQLSPCVVHEMRQAILAAGGSVDEPKGAHRG